jgi:uncharacterized protein YidB (DUF937 family)
MDSHCEPCRDFGEWKHGIGGPLQKGGFMSIFDKVTSMLGGTEGEQGGLISNVMKMLTDQQAGGLSGLVKSFEEKGLNDIIGSWIGTGENKAITPDQLQHGLGLERLQQLAEGSGLSVDGVKAKLAEVLPGLIDKLTPEGKLPEGSLLAQAVDLLKNKI